MHACMIGQRISDVKQGTSQRRSPPGCSTQTSPGSQSGSLAQGWRFMPVRRMSHTHSETTPPGGQSVPGPHDSAASRHPSPSMG